MRDDIIICPRCGFRFSITYARTFACQGCELAILGNECKFIKCPRCGYEFALDSSGDTLSLSEALKKFKPRYI